METLKRLVKSFYNFYIDQSNTLYSHKWTNYVTIKKKSIREKKDQKLVKLDKDILKIILKIEKGGVNKIYTKKEIKIKECKVRKKKL